jgi:hypothetical protein
MAGILDLFKTAKPEDFTRKMLPDASYLCQIDEAEPLPMYWKPNEAKGRAAVWRYVYVPKIRILDILPSGDNDLDAAIRDQLERFGDWKGYELRYTINQEIPGHDQRILCAGIEMKQGARGFGLNYALADMTPNWESIKEYSKALPRFWTSSDKNGNQDGWVVKVLSSSPDSHTPIPLPASDDPEPLPKVIAATIGAYLIVDLAAEVDPTGEYPDKLMVAGTSAP